NDYDNLSSDNYDDAESEESVKNLSVIEFNSIEIKEKFINFCFSKVSYAPYSFEEDHYLEDITKQAKFSKDDWNHGLRYIQNYDILEVIDTWDRMVLVKSIELLLQKRHSNIAIQQVCDLSESLLFVNSLILENIRKIDLIAPETLTIPRTIGQEHIVLTINSPN
ncbi:7682_t:CDS:2, partial [Dentiscutata erythropus]